MQKKKDKIKYLTNASKVKYMAWIYSQKIMR